MAKTAKNELREFFRQKISKAQPAKMNWARKQAEWIRAVEQLYDTIEGDYLKPARNEIQITRTYKTVEEAEVGEYEIPELTIRVGNERVVFSPIGINVFGAKGRIDIQGDRGEASVIWQPRNRWSIVASRAPTLRLVPLNAETLAEVLRGIMRP